MSTALANVTRVERRQLSRADYDRFSPLVRRIAMRMARRVPSHISVGDLVSCGWLGLLEAFSRAEGGMPVEEFEAYASHRVRGAMLDYLRGLDPATRQARNASRRVARVITQLTGQLDRQPEEHEIAASMGLELVAFRQLLSTIANAGMARLEVLDIDQVDPAEDRGAPDEEAGRRMLSRAVADAIQHLSPRLQQVLALYYQEDCTLREIGAVLGVSESRVSQLHTEAMHRLRAIVGKE
jgi:RNA polymerase sigma factor FliA